MGLQNINILSMAGLGTLNDVPPNTIQPKLVDAVHLRWAFRADLGFPWHGFYLFRRPSRRENRHCLRSRTRELQHGLSGASTWNSGIGILTSDEPLVIRDDFPPPGLVEFDLGGREYLDFIPSELAYEVDIIIGFRGNERDRRTCLSFTEFPPQKLPNPYERSPFSIRTIGPDKKPNPFNQIVKVEADEREVSAFLLSSRNEIKLDAPADVVELWIVGPERIVVRGADSTRRAVAGKRVPTAANSNVQHFRVEGSGITGLTIAVEGAAYLLAICAEGKDLRPVQTATITAYSGGFEVDKVVVTGHPGEMVPAVLRNDAIDRVRMTGENASLVELCWSSVFADATKGWEPVPKIKQPITLPVRHPDYPVNAGAVNVAASWALAKSRISYGAPNIWQVPFNDMHDQCLQLVQGGPATAMNDPSRATTFPATPEPGDTATPPTLPAQHPLHLTLLGSMHAPLAQMLGLYWSDATPVAGERYDYLIVADYTGAGGHDVQKALSEIDQDGFANLEGFIVFNKAIEPATPLDPPSDVRGYALPGTTRAKADGTIVDATCNAGLRWFLPMINNILLPESPALYHLWRTDYGDTKPGAEADETKFSVLNKQQPLLVTENLLSLSGVQRPQDWPQFPIYGFDNAVPEGWYGYRVNGVDVFGRHSGMSLAARWYEWAPVPAPRPWYYVDPPGDVSIDPFAIGLLDKVPPPPPAGVEAYALDPEDPFVQKDAAYVAWQATLSPAEKTSLIGLRVKWNWTEAHMRQAPDTKEFRVYFQNGRLNTRLGKTTTSTTASATETNVQTDIVHSFAANALVDCSLKIGSQMFTIVANDAASPLRVRVKNIGPSKDIRPAERVNCEVNIPNNHPLFVDYGVAHPWEERYYVVDYNDHVTVGVDDAGRPIRHYEIFLPGPGDAFRDSLPLNPDLADPIKFGAIGVTAVDRRVHTGDDPKWAAGRYGGRTGNESVMSPAALVFRVLRAKPAPPAPPPDSEKVFATAADYHAASFYTFRWAPQAHLRTHVYRAMDDTIFNIDWSYRPRTALAAGDLAFFPSEAAEPRWDNLKRTQVANELNFLNTFPHTAVGKANARKYYRGLSNDALRVLAALPHCEEAFAQITTVALDPDDPATANRVGPDNPPGYVVDAGLRIFIDTLDGRSTNRFFYRACYIDGAQNRSKLSLSGPPIWLPNVVPPGSPTFTKVLAGPSDNKITLRWASNREEDLTEYRIYRAMDEADARSIRSMTLVHTVAVPAGEPEDRPAENSWVDDGIPALRWIYYRMTAVDVAGNESAPNDAVTARAYDESLPPVPALAVAWEVAPANDARAQWTATTETRLERRAATELMWENATDWLPAGVHAVDDHINENFPWKYRLRARKATGAVAVGPVVNLLSK